MANFTKVTEVVQHKKGHKVRCIMQRQKKECKSNVVRGQQRRLVEETDDGSKESNSSIVRLWYCAGGRAFSWGLEQGIVLLGWQFCATKSHRKEEWLCISWTKTPNMFICSDISRLAVSLTSLRTSLSSLHSSASWALCSLRRSCSCSSC